jgi:hypothetical protein
MYAVYDIEHRLEARTLSVEPKPPVIAREWLRCAGLEGVR